MKSVFVFWMSLFALLIVGCAGHNAVKPASGKTPNAASATNAFAVSRSDVRAAATSPPKLIVTASNPQIGRITSVNGNLKFVVITFPIGYMPPAGRQMNLYRQGLKVGEVKITGPQRDDNIVADLTTGDAQLGDEAR